VLSARPARNAARVCLALGRRTGDAWYFERATYYCFHMIGNYSRSHVERVACLIILATTSRIRDGVDGLAPAMKVLRTAERALVHYPDRIQLWIRFYLERAKLFRDGARPLQGAASQKHKTQQERCVEYCRADVDSLLRLTGEDRKAWVERAKKVLAGLHGLQAKA